MSSCSAVSTGAETFDFELQAIGNEPRMLPTFVLTSNPQRFDEVTDPNIHFLGGDITHVTAAIHNLITAQIGDPNSLVFVFGGASVVSQMLEANLLDVVRLFVTPDILGSGTPLFELAKNQADASGDWVADTLSSFTQVNERKFSSGLVERIFARN
jgi:dihydrofolate reductase